MSVSRYREESGQRTVLGEVSGRHTRSHLVSHWERQPLLTVGRIQTRTLVSILLQLGVKIVRIVEIPSTGIILIIRIIGITRTIGAIFL